MTGTGTVTESEGRTAKNNNNNNNNNQDKEIKNVEKIERVVHRLKASACAIQSVTVYNDRAEITRVVEADLAEIGPHEVVVYDLSPEIEPESIRIAGGDGNAAILEVSHQEIFGEREDLDQTALMLKEIEVMLLEKQRLQTEFTRTRKERDWLDGFAQTIKTGGSTSTTPPLSLADLKVGDFLSNTTAFVVYYAEQLKRLDDRDTAIQKTIKELSNQESVLKKKIVQLQQQHLLAFRREVSVVMNVPAATKVRMQLSYIIMNAHWTPSYDVRMKSESDELELSYFGSITNASGEDWNNVRLSLSTASPSIGGAPPPLRPLRVDLNHSSGNSYAYNRPPPPRYTKNYEDDFDVNTKQVLDDISKNIETNLADFSNWQLDAVMEKTEQLQTRAVQFHKQARELKRKNFFSLKGESGGQGGLTVMTTFAESSHVGAANATFEIPNGSSIVSDNKPHKVTVACIPLKAKLSHYATPDTSGHVYLKATAINTTEQYPFLAGPISVFMNANFVSKSDMNDVSPQEKFSVFLGADSGVRLDVKPVRRVQEKQTGIINKNNSESFRHLFVVRNTRKDKVKLSVICQLPTSGDERIKVKLLRPDVKTDHAIAKLVDSKLLKWKLAIPPSRQEELEYHYVIEWPSGLNIVHLAGTEK